MSLTINTGMTTRDGGTVASGSFVQFETNFPAGELKYYISIHIWRSETDKNNGMQEVRGLVELPELNYEQDIVPEDFDSLTPAVIHANVKNYLESFLGADTVVINP